MFIRNNSLKKYVRFVWIEGNGVLLSMSTRRTETRPECMYVNNSLCNIKKYGWYIFVSIGDFENVVMKDLPREQNASIISINTYALLNEYKKMYHNNTQWFSLFLRHLLRSRIPMTPQRRSTAINSYFILMATFENT